MRLLHLYRPRLPGCRAQAVQVLHSCHALAARGHHVTLLADRGPAPATPARVLADFGLDAPPTLDLRISPWTHSGLAGWWFRRQLSAWWAGPPGLLLVRDQRRLLQALGQLGAGRHGVLLESHGLDSALAVEAGRDPAPARDEEARALAAAAGLVANCGGTLAAWRSAGHALPAQAGVLHNATAVRPLPEPVRDLGLLCLGSLRDYKGVDFIFEEAPGLPLPLVWVGGSAEERAARPPAAGVRLLPPVPPVAVGALLARAQVLLVPLQDNLFGRALTSPLKLWDALASGRPIVAPDLPAIHEIADLAGHRLFWYQPGQAGSLADAVAAAMKAPPQPAFCRSWDQRAAELEPWLQRVGPRP